VKTRNVPKVDLRLCVGEASSSVTNSTPLIPLFQTLKKDWHSTILLRSLNATVALVSRFVAPLAHLRHLERCHQMIWRPLGTLSHSTCHMQSGMILAWLLRIHGDAYITLPTAMCFEQLPESMTPPGPFSCATRCVWRRCNTTRSLDNSGIALNLRSR